MASIDTAALRDRAQGLLSGFSAGQRAVVILAIVGLIGGGALFVQWASKPSLVPLFSSLTTDDASAMTQELEKKAVTYELADGGRTILVPQKDVYQLRLDMAGAGLTAGGSEGYKLLDNGSSVTQSQFREQINYQRALEGELSKTISSIDGVKGAQVHLVIPKEDVFSQDTVKPTASVLIDSQPGRTLSTQAVQSIVNLTSTSVQGLTTDNVTVADSSGKLLSANGHAGADGNESQNQQTAATEALLNSKVASLLTPVVGEGKAVVQTRAELNWDKSKSTSEVFNPANKQAAIKSENITSEVYGAGAGGSAATGCVGTQTPVNGVCQPAQGSVPEGAADGGYANNTATRDFVNDREVTETEAAVGTPKRVTVAVLLDSNANGVDTTEIENLVTQAAGLQPARGDMVTVSRMPFDASAKESAEEQAQAVEKQQKTKQMMDIAKIAATVLIIMVVLLVLFITTKRRAKHYGQTIPLSMAELDAAMPPLGEVPATEPEVAIAPPEETPEAIERAKVDRDISDLIERQPDEVAQLLRGWLADRRG